MELDTIVRFHAKEGHEEAIANVMQEASGPVRAEPGCVFIGYYRSTRDPRLYFIHSRWKDETAFEVHAELPHTIRFIERMQPLIDRELKVDRLQEFLQF